MSAFRFERDAAGMNEAWRPLDRAVHRWVRAHGEGQSMDLLAATAAWASLADGHGDSALTLTDADNRHAMPALTDMQCQALLKHPMVGDDDSDRPFVIDDTNRFYLQRNHRNERSVAAALRVRREAISRFDAAVSDADIDALFNGAIGVEVEPQQRAVRSVGEHAVFVLTGGPGTGKTTTVLRMLLMLQHRSKTPLSVQVAAPTGKAAQRLVQALRDGKRQLLDHATQPLPGHWHDYLDRIPDGEAVTLHRLLGFQPWRNGFSRNARHPIPADVVVVDEASMIDLAMLRALLDAVRPDALLILVGDADQLTSVATGSVLMDLVTAMEATPDARDLVRLVHSFRAKPALVSINDAVRHGDPEALNAAMMSAAADAVRRDVHDAATLGKQLHAWTLRIATALGNAAEPAIAVADAFAALASQQLLCALREGPFGALAVNETLERLLRQAWNVPVDTEWYPGRAVIITRNDYAAMLFNGDVGICLAGADGTLRVWFEVARS
ncbi:MAG: AAA family ATPase, partial [Dokdonella sp.]